MYHPQDLHELGIQLQLVLEQRGVNSYEHHRKESQ
jgi:hypothetical protein